MAIPSMMRGPMGMSGALRGAGAGARALGGIGTGARSLGGLGAASTTGRGIGLFERLGSSLSALRGLNWGGFINNASKTLGVINQTIPLVRQVGPMMNNMKSMIRVASLFKDETDKPTTSKTQSTTTRHSSNSKNNPNPTTVQPRNNLNATTTHHNSKEIHTNADSSDSSPTFFVTS